MIDNLAYLGIYPQAIDNAIESAENAVRREFGGNDDKIDALNEQAECYLYKAIKSQDSITDLIILSYFRAATFMIKEKYPDPNDWHCGRGPEIDWIVNNSDSHLIIDGEEM